MRREKVYTLDDGSHWTARKIANLTGVSLQTARNRLQKSLDPARVLARRGLTTRDRG